LIPPENCPGIYKPFGSCGFQINHSVRLFTSQDLSKWNFVADVLPFPTRPTGIYFRPKVVFNQQNMEWVMWIYYLPEAPTPLEAYPRARYIVAVSPRPNGPFHIVNSNASVMYSGGGDFALLIDPYSSDGEAYIAYDAWENKHSVSVEKLTPSYHGSLGAQTSTGLISSKNNEAPILFARNGWYYLLFGHTCCFCQSGANSRVFTSKHMLGPWNDSGVDINAAKQIHGQENYVFEVQTTSGPRHIFTSDLWSSAPDHLKSHDFQFWYPLVFNDSNVPPTIQDLSWVDSFYLDL
jgi:beta-xylosidase